MRTFSETVQSLDVALIDLHGKPLRSEFDQWIKDYTNYPENSGNKEGIKLYDTVFKPITRILSKYRLLFKSPTIEITVDVSIVSVAVKSVCSSKE
jgi:hypothetical protein